MIPLLLIGGGGHCRACIDVIEETGKFEIAGVVQPEPDAREAVLGYDVLGSDEDLPVLLQEVPSALVTVGQIKSHTARSRLFKLLASYSANLPVVISPTGYCSRHAGIGRGTIVMHGAIVNAGAQVGENCIINSQALIEHDASVGAHCHISTGARINGGVEVGEGSFIGSGAVLREGVRIGSRTVVGAGQVVLRDLPSDTILRGSMVRIPC